MVISYKRLIIIYLSIITPALLSAQSYASRNSFLMLSQDALENAREIVFSDEAVLTDSENQFLMDLFCIDKTATSLCLKKVAFFTGNLGESLRTKKDFFESEVNSALSGDTPIPAVIYLFNETESRESGYDAAIIYYYKRLPSKARIIRIIKHGLAHDNNSF